MDTVMEAAKKAYLRFDKEETDVELVFEGVAIPLHQPELIKLTHFADH